MRFGSERLVCGLGSTSLLVSQLIQSGCGLVPSGGAHVFLQVVFVDWSSRWGTITAFCFLFVLFELGYCVAPDFQCSRGFFKLLTLAPFHVSSVDYGHEPLCSALEYIDSKTYTPPTPTPSNNIPGAPVIPVPGRPKQKDCEFKTSPGYTVRSCSKKETSLPLKFLVEQQCFQCFLNSFHHSVLTSAMLHLVKVVVRKRLSWPVLMLPPQVVSVHRWMNSRMRSSLDCEGTADFM